MLNKELRTSTCGVLVLSALWAGCAAAPKPAAVAPFAMGTPDLVLLVTGDDHGKLEVCSCPGPMTGGLARRSGLFLSYRAAFPRTIALDSGDVLWIEPEAIQNRYVLEGYRLIGYDAVALGDNEWSVPLPLLRDLLAASRQVYLSTTVAPVDPKASAGLGVAPGIRQEWADLKVAVLAAVGEDAMQFAQAETRGQLTIAPMAALARQVRELKDRGCLVVLICHGDEEYVETCAKGTEADVIVRGHTAWTSADLLGAAGKPVLKVGGTEEVGVAALRVRGGRVTKIEYRVEVIDMHWPADERLLELFRRYVAEEKRAGAKER